MKIPITVDMFLAADNAMRGRIVQGEARLRVLRDGLNAAFSAIEIKAWSDGELQGAIDDLADEQARRLIASVT